jgi:hypothetical protein
MSNKYKNMDDFFREKFADFEHEPPEHIWLNVKQTIHKPKGGGGLAGGKMLALAITLLVAGSFTLYLLLNNTSENKEVIQQNPPETINSVSGEALLAQNTEITEPAENSNLETPFEFLEETEYQPIEFTVPKKKDKQKINQKKSQEKGSAENTKAIPDAKISSSGLLASAIENNFLTPGDDSELLAINDEIVDVSIESQKTDESSIINQSEESFSEQTQETHEANNPMDGPELKSDYGKNSEIQFGLFFTPEVIFYPGDNNISNRSYAIDLNAIYKFSDYFLQSGLGLAFASDQGKYKIDYNKYMGSYEDVYNVTFDSTSNGVIPIYHTETVNVYDSVTYAQVEPSKNRFTYLQVPVLFGYGKENRRLGWFVKGGPSLSILIRENVYDMGDMQEHKILNVETDLPSRIKTHWQFIISGGMNYRLGNHLSLSVEPMMRYFMNSVYEQGFYNTKHPYSFGLRTGLLLNF